MNNVVVRRVAWVASVASVFALVGTNATAAQPALTLQASGTFANNGSFAGTVTINRFEQRGNQIVAIGFVQGTLTRPNRVIGTAFAGEVTLPVSVTTGGVVLADNRAVGASEVRLLRWPADESRRFRMFAVQATGCTPVQIGIGATNVNLLGVQVALDPVGITATGQAGAPLGDLVCAAANLLGNVAGLVNLLNSLLGTLTGLVGGIV